MTERSGSPVLMVPALTVLLVLGLAFAARGLGLGVEEERLRPCSQVRLAEGAWRQASTRSGEAYSDRHRLARDLVRCRVLLGHDRRWVTRRLGEGDRAERWRFFPTGRIEHFGELEPTELGVEFDRRGVVVRAVLEDPLR